MVIDAARIPVDPQHFWLRGEKPAAPVDFDEARGVWNVYGHREAVEVLGDPKTFSSDIVRVMPIDLDPALLEGDLTQLDPPQHRKLRRLVSHAFTPKIVADLEPRIAALTHELLDAVADEGRFELVADLAYPLPVIVIAELLGVPSSDRDLFQKWVEEVLSGGQQLSVSAQGEEQLREMNASPEGMREINDYLLGHAAERRRNPREDLLTQLVQAQVDGERLTDNEVVNFAGLLLAAGHITTTMLLGNTVMCLDAHPEQAARVRADRALVPGAIEESLRLLAPFALTYRATTTEAEVGGRRVPADQVLSVWLGAANRDDRVFAAPDAFDPARDPNPHIAFGRGIHFCLGAPLARLEGRIAMDILLDRFPVLRTDPANPPVLMPGTDMIGATSLPVLAE
ncbi:Cytochrome P450 [Saccharopolyspora shandongensis]|uniref:Cytochrome P450 n=1 Tax=Saccharopolyspora shandongensis TaxID=418495 RepID=A0A1H2V1D8_9PSEU|nr:cytochrome P450 [Saccharopolyspora shandongensis]SDW62146.1 Cytochrome P450 [Saccharopolyspora shandongensis]